MMKKILIGFGVLIGLVFVLLMAGRITGGLRWYTSPTPANEPTLKTGSTFLTSNLKTTGRGNFIIYKSRSSDSSSPHESSDEIVSYNYVKRLCGMPGDVLQMKNGILFVNGENFDKGLNLKSF